MKSIFFDLHNNVTCRKYVARCALVNVAIMRRECARLQKTQGQIEWTLARWKRKRLAVFVARIFLSFFFLFLFRLGKHISLEISRR